MSEQASPIDGAAAPEQPKPGFNLSRWALQHIPLTRYLLIVLLLLGYHHACWVMLRKFRAGQNRRNHVWYRWFNEAPVIMMVIAVALVVVKPF